MGDFHRSQGRRLTRDEALQAPFASPDRCGRSSNEAASKDLEALCGTIFTGPFAPWSGNLSFYDHPDSATTDVLDDRAVFDDLLRRFGQAYPGADRRALASFWSQHYFAKLVIATTVFCLAADRPLPLDLIRVRVRFCPETGLPLCFHLGCGGPVRTPEALIKALYEEQVADAVARVKRHAGLSARLLWENAGWYGTWALGAVAHLRSDLSAAADRLLSDPLWPRAACAILPHLKEAALAQRTPVRRICCLRDRLPGVACCGAACPLASGKGLVAPSA